MEPTSTAIDYTHHLSAVQRLAQQHRGLLEFQAAVAAYLHDHIPHYNWVGFYMREGVMLALGPFKGKPTPHTMIPISQGICGAAVREGQTIVVDDVHSDPRYLACSIETKSEIVVPLFKDGEAVGELDLDSDQPAAFTDQDRAFLEQVAKVVEGKL